MDYRDTTQMNIECTKLTDWYVVIECSRNHNGYKLKKSFLFCRNVDYAYFSDTILYMMFNSYNKASPEDMYNIHGMYQKYKRQY